MILRYLKCVLAVCCQVGVAAELQGPGGLQVPECRRELVRLRCHDTATFPQGGCIAQRQAIQRSMLSRITSRPHSLQRGSCHRSTQKDTRWGTLTSAWLLMWRTISRVSCPANALSTGCHAGSDSPSSRSDLSSVTACANRVAIREVPS